jgi:hypothetical protein
VVDVADDDDLERLALRALRWPRVHRKSRPYM